MRPPCASSRACLWFYDAAAEQQLDVVRRSAELHTLPDEGVECSNAAGVGSPQLLEVDDDWTRRGPDDAEQYGSLLRAVEPTVDTNDRVAVAVLFQDSNCHYEIQ